MKIIHYWLFIGPIIMATLFIMEGFRLNEKVKAYFSLGLAMAIIGASVSVGKLVIGYLPVFLASGLRYALAAAILFWLLWREGGMKQSITRWQGMWLFLQSLTGQFLFSVLLLFGLKYLSSAESGILTSTMPAVLALLSWLLLKEKIGWNKWLGIFSVAAGMIVMNVVGGISSADRGSNELLGSILVFGAVIGESLFTIVGKKLSSHLSPIMIASYVSLFGFLSFFPAAVYEAIYFDFDQVPIHAWLALFVFGSVMTVVPFILICRGLQFATGAAVAILTGVMPISGLVCSALLLSEPIYWYHGLGVGGIFLGLSFLALETKKEQKA